VAGETDDATNPDAFGLYARLSHPDECRYGGGQRFLLRNGWCSGTSSQHVAFGTNLSQK
jgi:hypothetical protein